MYFYYGLGLLGLFNFDSIRPIDERFNQIEMV